MIPDTNKIDALVAERVMGWTHAHQHLQPISFWSGGPIYSVPWCPSHNMIHAMEVWQHFRAKDIGVQLDSSGFDGAPWRCMIGWGDDPVSAEATAPTAPLAICHAALLAVGLTPPTPAEPEKD